MGASRRHGAPTKSGHGLACWCQAPTSGAFSACCRVLCGWPRRCAAFRIERHTYPVRMRRASPDTTCIRLPQAPHSDKTSHRFDRQPLLHALLPLSACCVRFILTCLRLNGIGHKSTTGRERCRLPRAAFLRPYDRTPKAQKLALPTIPQWQRHMSCGFWTNFGRVLRSSSRRHLSPQSIQSADAVKPVFMMMFCREQRRLPASRFLGSCGRRGGKYTRSHSYRDV